MKKYIPLSAFLFLIIECMSAQTQQPLHAVISSRTNLTCYGTSSGDAIVSVSGGVMPYTYLWVPGGETSDTATYLTAGTYTVVVSDSISDTVYAHVVITQPPLLIIHANTLKDVGCFGTANGKVATSVHGGSPPYQYLWQPVGATTDTATGLVAQTYTSIVTDLGGCVGKDTTPVREPAALSLTATTISSSVYAMATGGMLPYTFRWTPPVSTTALATGLSPGTYTIIVNDSNLCTNSVVITITGTTKGLGLALANEGSTCGNNPPQANILVYAASFPNTLFHSCVMDIHYSNSEFYPDTNGYGIYVIPSGDFSSYDYLNTVTLSDSVMEIRFGDTANAPPTNEVELTDTAQILFYITFQIQSPCEAGAVSFTNTVTTTYESHFTDSTLVGSSYVYSDSAYITMYDTGLTIPACGSTISITDFNDTIRAGIGDTLTIAGTGFGGIRGTGQVKFRDADTNHQYHIQKLNATDYISWADNQIQIRLPAFVDSVHGSIGNEVTVGGKNFIVTNSCGDSAVSNLNSNHDPFAVKYNLNQFWNPHNSMKEEVLLRSRDTSGGYLIRFDSATFPQGSIQRLIFTKAMKDWTCFIGMNWTVGKDTSYTYSPHHFWQGLNYVFFDSLLLSNFTVAQTDLDPSACSNNTDFLEQGVIYFNKHFNFKYDTTETISIPSGWEDFYGICLHELGHFIGLNHTTDSTALMYFTANQGFIAAANRITLATPASATAVAGASYSVQKGENITTSCISSSAMTGKGTACTNEYTGVKPLTIPTNNTFVIYPNPTNGTFTIDASISDYTLIVTDMLGQRIFSRKINEEKTTISLSSFAEGMYFVQEQYNNGLSAQKIIITK